MRCRVRGPGGTTTISLPDDATVADLLSEITSKTSVTRFDIKYGYPPRLLRLEQSDNPSLLSKLEVKLDGEQLTISPIEDETTTKVAESSTAALNKAPNALHTEKKASNPIALQHKAMEGEVPEIPLPERGATLVLRVMPDDNSCLFRAFATAVLPGDHQTMIELRSLCASKIQADAEKYTQVVLEQKPDDYCRWIQTEDAWGGAIEMGILADHFDVEICSIDVQSLRSDRFNEGALTRCILVYSGIHYDTLVQSPSEPPHTKADSPPEFDVRVFDSDDYYIEKKAKELCKKLQSKHYYTDTGGMAIKCNDCGAILYGQGQASGHATQLGHYNMQEVQTAGG